MPCPACGAEQATDSMSCPKCSEKRRRRGRRSETAAQGDVPLGPKPPLNNPRAIHAYRCAVFGLIPFAGLVLGPLALRSGILGLRHVKVHPQDKGGSHAVAGIVLGLVELLTNWLGLLFLLIGLATLLS